LLKEPDNFGVLGVEILPDANLPLPRAKPPLCSRAAVRDEPRDRFTGLCKHNFLTCGSFFDEPRQMGLCRLNVYALHSRLRFESGIDCIRIVVGKSRIELPLEEKLRLLKEARKRQQLRNKDFRLPTKTVRRGWRRDDLYERGTTH